MNSGGQKTRFSFSRAWGTIKGKIKSQWRAYQDRGYTAVIYDPNDPITPTSWFFDIINTPNSVMLKERLAHSLNPINERTEEEEKKHVTLIKKGIAITKRAASANICKYLCDRTFDPELLYNEESKEKFIKHFAQALITEATTQYDLSKELVTEIDDQDKEIDATPFYLLDLFNGLESQQIKQQILEQKKQEIKNKANELIKIIRNDKIEPEDKKTLLSSTIMNVASTERANVLLAIDDPNKRLEIIHALQPEGTAVLIHKEISIEEKWADLVKYGIPSKRKKESGTKQRFHEMKI